MMTTVSTSKRPRRVVGERISDWPKPDRWVWHLYDKADPEAWFTEVRCGGGVTLPGAYQTRPESDVCPDCLAGRKTL
ncbi:hypothetical protein ABRQ22_17325 [Cellulosimicrobium sp. ES-005]|uniref:Zinc-ribbon domain-containing protein n=1 Tax=Cellulosimicrobium sp. ES-005 TaxID=3163031 RepID=A0AAU8G0T0_9MICO